MQKHITGILSVNARGFGFVAVDGEQDLFIPLENLSTGMDGDTVTAEIIKGAPGKKRAGRIIKVVKPSSKDLVGVYRKKGDTAFVTPNDERLKRAIEIPPDRNRPAKQSAEPADGDVVVVRRERWDDPGRNPSGRVIENLGSPDDPGMDLRIIAKSKGLRTFFPQDVEKETAALALPSMRQERKRREDLRKKTCFTIDPESARDFDDAVSLEQLDNGMFELGVHIADVSYFVREGSALDREALERGTSVYFVNEVVPMLPEKLSTDLCSLKPDEDRLAFSVIMEIDSRGKVFRYRITESIIRSKRRFTYREVEDILGGGGDRYARTLHQMMLLSLALRRNREEMGSIDFDVPVPVISLDKNGIPFEVKPSERIDANRLVEEFMLAANLTVARHMVEKNSRKEAKGPWPFIYRVHEKPNDEDVAAFLDLLKSLGINYRIPGELEPEDYRRILEVIENLDFKDFAEKIALRSMTKAVYSTDNIGHFGLAFDAYTHFTSPIRRYPDLMVHRLLKKYAAGGTARSAGKSELQKICDQCSARELVAVNAEREYTRMKSMQFLSGKVGETYNGVIAGITSFGFFVELTHYLIEGLVHVSELKDDHYEFDKDNYTLTGEKTGKTYRLGDPVRITIKSVSVKERKADFVLADAEKEKRGRQRRRR